MRLILSLKLVLRDQKMLLLLRNSIINLTFCRYYLRITSRVKTIYIWRIIKLPSCVFSFIKLITFAWLLKCQLLNWFLTADACLQSIIVYRFLQPVILIVQPVEIAIDLSLMKAFQLITIRLIFLVDDGCTLSITEIKRGLSHLYY